MSPATRSVAFLSFALGMPVAAQTFIVDAANGPGASFTDLPPAVAAVPDGATLIVRAGNYHSFSIVSKGLTILGEPGAAVSDFGVLILLGYTAPQQAIVIRGLRFHGALGARALRPLDFPAQADDPPPAPDVRRR